jgi:DNA polymerase III delta subunit
MSQDNPNVVLVSGNQYDVDSYLSKIKTKIKCDQVCKIYSDSCDSNHIIEEIISSDIFGSKTLYIIKDLPAKDYNNMISAFTEIPPESYVVFYTYGSFKKYKKFTSAIVKLCGKNSIVEYPDKVKDMESLARDIIKDHRKKISDSALHKLISMIGSNTGILNKEIEKLVNYVGKSSVIKDDDVEDICWIDDDFVVWDLLSALSSKNLSLSMKILAKAFRNGVACESMLFMITRSLRLSLVIADCKDRKMTEKDMGQQIKKIKKKEGAIAYSDYEVNKTVSNRMSFCNNFTLDQLLRAFYSTNQGFLRIRSVYDPGEKEREMSLLVYAICHPDNVVRVYDKGVEYVG